MKLRNWFRQLDCVVEYHSKRLVSMLELFVLIHLSIWTFTNGNVCSYVDFLAIDSVDRCFVVVLFIQLLQWLMDYYLVGAFVGTRWFIYKQPSTTYIGIVLWFAELIFSVREFRYNQILFCYLKLPFRFLMIDSRREMIHLSDWVTLQLYASVFGSDVSTKWWR